MQTRLLTLLTLLLVATLCFAAPAADEGGGSGSGSGDSPKMLRISGQFDGSGKIVFTRKGVQYEHKHWKQPTNVVFNGAAWEMLERTPEGWGAFSDGLDLSRAKIIKRAGRDVIALEQTKDGFDLYICDSPNGAADYEVTIEIPRNK
jgi:hypothetical protein